MQSKSRESAIPSDVQSLIRTRNALLWVCQRYDLVAGEEPHEIDEPQESAALRYRLNPNETDNLLGSFFWQAAWLEGARSPLIQTFQKNSSQSSSGTKRHVVVLSSDADVLAKLDSDQFFPVCVLPGVIGEKTPGNYGLSGRKARERISWGFTERLVQYQGRILVVVGIESAKDISYIWESLNELPLVNLRVLLVSPSTGLQVPPIRNPGVRVDAWRGTDQDFCHALRSISAPLSNEIASDNILVRGKPLRFSHAELARVSARWKVILDSDLIAPSQFSIDDLNEFLGGSLENMKGYGADLFIERSYRSGRHQALYEEAKGALSLLERKQEWATSHVLQLPAESGSGVTTLLRNTAFRLAKDGYPALILRSEVSDIDVEDLQAFATLLWEKALAADVPIEALVLVVDKEHQYAFQTKQTLQALVASGRGVLVLQATEIAANQDGETRSGRRTIFLPFRAKVTSDEIVWCNERISRAAQRWSLQLDVPTQESWTSYARATEFVGESRTSSLFWVALRFFLTSGMEVADASVAKSALSGWIEKRAVRITNSTMRAVVRYVALLSFFRIVAPLWTVLRPATGGSFSSDLVPTLKELDGVVEWHPIQQSLGDQILRFAHPDVADEFLRSEGLRDERSRLIALKPLQAALTSGRVGDVFVADMLAYLALSPGKEDRGTVNWEDRLEAFEAFPPQVSFQSPTILHHWARCQYLSADIRHSSGASIAERKTRVIQAIEKLRTAIKLPSTGVQHEHPSHLHNTAGTAYARLASLLQAEGTGARREADEAWDLACKEFSEAIRYSGIVNIEAMLAFAHRLLLHAGVKNGRPVTSSQQFKDVLDAIGRLDDAHEALSEHPNPEPSWEAEILQERAVALAALNEEEARRFVDELRVSEPELALICDVQLLLSRSGNPGRINEALDILRKGRSDGSVRTHRALSLWLSLSRQDENASLDFEEQISIYVELEKDPTYILRPIEKFRHAVVCYQIGQFSEGAQRFRAIREQTRREGLSLPRVREIWRDQTNPQKPRITSIRITRIVSEFRGEGYVNDLSQVIPIRPRQFSPKPSVNDVVVCGIRFEGNGPLAVPERFVLTRDINR